MVEAIGGNLHLKTQELTESFVVARYLREKMELRKIVRKEKHLNSAIVKLQKAENKGDIEKFVKNEETNIHEIISIMSIFAHLTKHLIFDIHKIKQLLYKMYDIDIAAVKKGFPKKIEEKLIKEDKDELAEVNALLRMISDEFGALTKE
ncbi:MAG: hypothetical protein ABIC91_08540 [Nanoarchaeota archaeon]|nr:hypothetical protein [Nanoarchaeota archaeon]MBU1030317.1 hypothetical protein [Nanoarchaeota archaeon]MBU1849104.1 hypothetical protein [Nanoarchaeota archaeon]